MTTSYDISSKVGPYLDPHMQVKMLDFLKEKSVMTPESAAKQRLRCLLTTDRFAEIKEAHKAVTGDASEFAAAMAALGQREEVSSKKLKEATASAAFTKCAAFFADQAAVDALKECGKLTLEGLSASDAALTTEALDEYASVAKMHYEAGNYSAAEAILVSYCSIGRGAGTAGEPISISALWGKLACRLLQSKWQKSVQDFTVVRNAIEHKSIPAIQQLQHRAFLLHWGLFLQFSASSDVVQLDIFGDRYYLNAMENAAPWMLRYYAVSVILFNRRKHMAIEDLRKEIRHLKYSFQDCFTNFMQELYDAFDYTKAQMSLKDCVSAMENDFFLCAFADKFKQQARLLLCEVYCQLNRTVSLAALAEKLELTEDEAERWVVDLVRSASLATVFDACIDSSGKQVVMSTPQKTGRSAIAESTQDLTARAALMAANLQKLATAQATYLTADK